MSEKKKTSKNEILRMLLKSLGVSVFVLIINLISEGFINLENSMRIFLFTFLGISMISLFLQAYRKKTSTQPDPSEYKNEKDRSKIIISDVIKIILEVFIFTLLVFLLDALYRSSLEINYNVVFLTFFCLTIFSLLIYYYKDFPKR